MSVRQSAGEPTAQAFGASPGGAVVDPTGWDADKLYGCVCDSEWAVGYGPGQMQAAQFYGADCSLARCPSADDPRTADVDETDCEFMDGVSCREMISLPIAIDLAIELPAAKTVCKQNRGKS